MNVLHFRSKELRLGAERRRRRRSTGNVSDPSLGQTAYRSMPGSPPPPRRISMRKRGFLLTVYKRACIFPPDILEERHDQT
jgi:hypothetical protein